MAFVLDCSVTLAWVFRDKATRATDKLLGSLIDGRAFAPALWPIDVADAFLVATRHGRVEPSDWPWVRHILGTLPITIDPVSGPRVWAAVVDTASAADISVYDSMYLELAQRMRLPLATLDRSLAAAAQVAGVDALALGATAVGDHLDRAAESA